MRFGASVVRIQYVLEYRLYRSGAIELRDCAAPPAIFKAMKLQLRRLNLHFLAGQRQILAHKRFIP